MASAAIACAIRSSGKSAAPTTTRDVLHAQRGSGKVALGPCGLPASLARSAHAARSRRQSDQSQFHSPSTATPQPQETMMNIPVKKKSPAASDVKLLTDNSRPRQTGAWLV